MKNLDIALLGRKTIILAVIALYAVFGVSSIDAHGDEDHGDAKAKTTTSTKGTVIRTIRLGDVELTFKHSVLVPDTAAAARLFVTRFSSNEAVAIADLKIQIEAPNGSVIEVSPERTEAAGTYLFTIPALPTGAYVLRAAFSHDGATDTATFSDITVESNTLESGPAGPSWLRTFLIFIVGSFVLALFATLIYVVWRFADNDPTMEEAST